MGQLGFGIVGCGMISQFHAKAIEKLRRGKLIACYSTPQESADRFAAEHKIKAYTTLEGMLADPEIDIVCICTPSGSHLEPALAAANAGKHVVIEKPLEITLKRCDAILNAVEKNRVMLCPILPARFSPANIALKDAINDGRFGKITLGDSYVKWWRTQEYYDSGGWRGTWALDGGGAYMNQAIHNVDLLLWFMGDVSQICGFTDTIAHERIEVEDVGVASLKFKNGAVGVMEATTSAFPGLLRRTEIHGSEGSVIVEQDDVLLWHFSKEKPKDRAIREKFAKKVGGTGGASDPKAISFTGHFEQLKDFCCAIDTGGKPAVSGLEARKSVEAILAIYQSSWTSKVITLPLAKDPVIPASKKRKA